MTTALMRRVASRVAGSALGEPILVYLDGVEYLSRGTRVRDEVLRDDDGGRRVGREHRIRIPAADLPEAPTAGDQVETDGRFMHVVGCLEEGPTYVLTLSLRSPD